MRAQEKKCPNPYYPQWPYVLDKGCWYQKDTQDGYLSGEAPACDSQGGWSDSSAPAPLAENSQPAKCALGCLSS